MICTLTARRLNPGAYESFRAAWEPSDSAPDALAAGSGSITAAISPIQTS